MSEAVRLAGEERIDIGRVLVDHGVRAGLHEFREARVLRDEVRLRVDFNDNADLAAVRNLRKRNAFRSDSARLLDGSCEALLAKELGCLLHVAVRLGKRLLAVHHAAAGLRSERRDVFCCKAHFLFLLPVQLGSGKTDYASVSASSFSSVSCAAAPIWPSRPSMIAFAIAPAIRRTARIASSLPGIT